MAKRAFSVPDMADTDCVSLYLPVESVTFSVAIAVQAIGDTVNEAKGGLYYTWGSRSYGPRMLV